MMEYIYLYEVKNRLKEYGFDDKEIEEFISKLDIQKQYDDF
jgi:SOS response regulatory protein OraA/RecX